MVEDAANTPRSTPQKYLVALAVLMAVSAWLAVLATGQRAATEEAVPRTALGDMHLHPSGGGTLPVPLLGLPLAHFQGEPLYPRAKAVKRLEATRLRRVGVTDEGGHGVYRREGDADPVEFFLLVGWDDEDPGQAVVRLVGERRYRGADPP